MDKKKFIIIFLFLLITKTLTYAKLQVDTNITNISYLAYSEFANDYVFGGKINSSCVSWVNPDNTLAIYESSVLYQFDSGLKKICELQIKDLQPETKTNDTTKINQLNNDIKIIPLVDSDKSYFLIKKPYTTYKKDLEEIDEKLTEIKNDEKSYLFTLQTFGPEEQKERNKLAAIKSSLSSINYTEQINEIKRKFVIERHEIEKKMMALFRKQNELEYKKALMKNKKSIIEIHLKPSFTTIENINLDTTQYTDNKKNVLPDNFWGINLFDLDLIVTDKEGLFYGFRKEDNRIYVFDYTGELLLSFIVSNIPSKILVDKNKYIYVITDSYIYQFKPIGFTNNFLKPTTNNLNVIGSIATETTWSGRILISGETRVEKDAILNILPGTEIIFTKSASSCLNIHGTLKAIGSKDNYIIFKSDTPYPFGEINIFAEQNQENSIISFCRFEFMQYGLKIYDSSPEITKNIFIKNEDAIWYQGSMPDYATKCLINKNTIKDNLVGILVTFLISGVNPTIQYNNIYDNRRTNFTYKNTEKIDLSNNFWGMTDIDKIRKTITVESKEEEKINIILDPAIPVPFDIMTEE